MGMVSTREIPPAVGVRSVVLAGVDIGRSVSTTGATFGGSAIALSAIVGSAVPLGMVVGYSFVASGEVVEMHVG